MNYSVFLVICLIFFCFQTLLATPAPSPSATSSFVLFFSSFCFLSSSHFFFRRSLFPSGLSSIFFLLGILFKSSPISHVRSAPFLGLPLLLALPSPAVNEFALFTLFTIGVPNVSSSSPSSSLFSLYPSCSTAGFGPSFVSQTLISPFLLTSLLLCIFFSVFFSLSSLFFLHFIINPSLSHFLHPFISFLPLSSAIPQHNPRYIAHTRHTPLCSCQSSSTPQII